MSKETTLRISPEGPKSAKKDERFMQNLRRTALATPVAGTLLTAVAERAQADATDVLAGAAAGVAGTLLVLADGCAMRREAPLAHPVRPEGTTETAMSGCSYFIDTDMLPDGTIVTLPETYKGIPCYGTFNLHTLNRGEPVPGQLIYRSPTLQFPPVGTLQPAPPSRR